MQRILVQIVRVVIVSALWRVVQRGIRWWGNRGRERDTPEERLARRQRTRGMSRNAQMLRRLTRWMR